MHALDPFPQILPPSGTLEKCLFLGCPYFLEHSPHLGLAAHPPPPPPPPCLAFRQAINTWLFYEGAGIEYNKRMK